MQISIAHARGAKGSWYHLDLPEPVTAAQALAASPVFQHYPDLDIAVHKIGIFGKLCKPDTILHEGDRVEIYLPANRPEVSDDDDDD
jgi:putative ubiquitin-RnfH superfamily antitoxin RatB of RatAB toxin-antitoxin module